MSANPTTNQPVLSPNSPLVTHANQLVQLDRMMADGRGDSAQADALRDTMDGSWYGMTADESEIARQISADLYTLHDDPLVRHPSDFSIYSPELASQLAALMANGEYLRALRLMQERPSEISRERAALFRAILYRALGLPEIGLIFFEQVAPADGSKTASLPLLGFLWQHVNLDTASAAACAGHFTSAPEWNAT